MNPTLGRNLGRWAQVYFTSPPEKRESAVVELLRELEGDVPPQPSLKRNEASRPAGQPLFTAPPLETAVAATQPVEALPASGAVPEMPQVRRASNDNDEVMREPMVCPSCREESPAGQAYCGICGAALHAVGVERRKEGASARPEAAAADAASELQWLRERVPENWGREEIGNRHSRRFLAIALVLVLGVIVYLERGAWNTLLAPSKPAAHNPARAVAEKPAPARATPDAVAAESSATQPRPSPEADHPDRALAESSRTAGEQELVEAQRILAIPGQSADTSEAAKLLWRAVGKQNSSATLMLADLYLRGEGVARNCEQARLLLAAAARTGSSAAAGRLRQVEANGCP